MPELITPGGTVHGSFLAAMTEFQAEGRGGSADDSMLGSEMRDFNTSWRTLDGFAAFVAALRAQAAGTQLPDGHVACTTLWWAEGPHYLGRIAIRHQLTVHLLEVAGHIGYDVRPTVRRRGHATSMLRAALPVARRIGIESALITCDTTNVPSRKVIESCGGELEDERAGKLRFWVPTG